MSSIRLTKNVLMTNTYSCHAFQCVTTFSLKHNQQNERYLHFKIYISLKTLKKFPLEFLFIFFFFFKAKGVEHQI